MKKKKKKQKKKVWMLGLLILVGIGTGVWKYQSENTEYSKERISAQEAENEIEAATGVRIELEGEYLTYGRVEEVLEQIHLKDYITYEKKQAAKKISRTDWHEIYAKILDYLNTENKVVKKEVLILGKDTVKKSVFTSKGTYEAQGVKLEKLATYKLYISDNKILGIIEKKEGNAILENVYLKSLENQSAEILFDGKEYTFDATGSDEKMGGIVCDIVFDGEKIREIHKKEETVTGNLITMEDSEIEIEGYGKIPLAERVPAYKVYGTLEEKSLDDIVIGNMNVEYVVGEGKVQAVLLKEPADIENIRVLLLNGDSPYYENICLSADKDFNTKVGKKKEKHKAGEVISAAQILENTKASCKVRTSDGGKIYLTKEDGTPLSLSYNGSMELRKTENGYTIVNEVGFEDYICGVLPSEMPETFDSEALKAQAVCARSYAYMQLMKGDYAALGAHVDDSTNYQVYNKKEAGSKSEMAVKDTAGQVLKYQGNVIEAYYYSTSCGHTGTMENWNQKNDETYGYLKSIWVEEEQKKKNLSKEKTFRKYITSQDEKSFDGSVPYFRWTASLDFNGKDEEVRNILTAAKEANSKNISFYVGNKKKKSLKGFGAVTEVTVKERGKSGAIAILKVQFENGTALVKSEYNIRKVLGAALQEVICQDGTKNNSLNILPSAYCVIDYSVEQKKASVSGGGFGHGIGMSQYGADGMAKSGYTYEEILEFFYQDVVLEGIY